MTALSRGSTERPIVLQEAATDRSDPHRHLVPQLDPKVQALIGERLRLYYAELLTEPVPERLVDLIDRFAQSRKDRS